ncbi:MAG: FAD-dependent monooxygenase, partial [Burkholderiales bacterium]
MSRGGRPLALVAGAGIGGLATGIACGRAGFDVQVFERAAAFAPIGAGIQLGPNATRVLHGWGLDDALAAIASFPDQLVVHHAYGGSELGSLPLGERAVRRYGAPYATVHRGDLHRLLLASFHAQPHTQLHLGRPIDAFTQGEAGVAVPVTNSGDVTKQAGLLVGADGLWSAVRERLLIDGPPQAVGHLAYRALVRQSDLPEPVRNRNQVNVWLGRRLHVVAYPVRGGDCLNVVGIVHRQHDLAPTRPRSWDEATDAADLLAAIGDCSTTLEALIRAVPAWRLWTLYDRPPMRSAREHGHGRVVLIGDAAHPMRPYLAQGAGMAIEDAAMLEAVLTGTDTMAIPPALKRFAEQRWRRNARVQARARRNSEIFHATGLLAAGRNLAMRLL